MRKENKNRRCFIYRFGSGLLLWILVVGFVVMSVSAAQDYSIGGSADALKALTESQKIGVNVTTASDASVNYTA